MIRIYKFGNNMEDSKLTNRLTLAVYLFLAVLAVILALVGIKYIQSDSPTRDLIINLSTEILGVVIIFFIVNQLFLLNKERDFVKQIESIKDDIKSRFSPLIWQNEIRDQFDFISEIHDSQYIYLLGYNIEDFLQKFREQIIKSIIRGTNVKIIIINNNSIAGDLIRINLSASQKYDEGAKRSLEYLLQIKEFIDKNENSKGSIEIRLVTWIPSCRIILIERENETGIAKIRIHSPCRSLPLGRIREPLNLILDKEKDSREFNYFKKNFELLWKSKTAKILDEEFLKN